MKNISNIIENHLKFILDQSKKGYIEIQRSELADQFQCVPSQINYVINTRFTVEKGYLIESKRGGGGFIRIRKVQLVKNQAVLQTILDMIGDEIPQATSEDIIERLFEIELITDRESRLMKAVIQRNILSFNVQIRDQLRAKILQAMIIALMYK
jgi:transcriptional regulator CtsR